MTRRWSPQSRRLRKGRNFCCWLPRKTSDSCPRGASCLRKGPGRALSGSPVPWRRRRSKVRTRRWAATGEQNLLQHAKSTDLCFTRCVRAIRACLHGFTGGKHKTGCTFFHTFLLVDLIYFFQNYLKVGNLVFLRLRSSNTFMIMTDDLGLLQIHSFILLSRIRNTRT